MHNTTTICALASALGQGGIGVVRVSGTLAGGIAQKMLGKIPKARYAHYGSFFDQEGDEIDKGVALFFLKHSLA
jgi:tRNA modification GTPase